MVSRIPTGNRLTGGGDIHSLVLAPVISCRSGLRGDGVLHSFAAASGSIQSCDAELRTLGSAYVTSSVGGLICDKALGAHSAALGI